MLVAGLPERSLLSFVMSTQLPVRRNTHIVQRNLPSSCLWLTRVSEPESFPAPGALQPGRGSSGGWKAMSVWQPRVWGQSLHLSDLFQLLDIQTLLEEHQV